MHYYRLQQTKNGFRFTVVKQNKNIYLVLQHHCTSWNFYGDSKNSKLCSGDTDCWPTEWGFSCQPAAAQIDAHTKRAVGSTVDLSTTIKEYFALISLTVQYTSKVLLLAEKYMWSTEYFVPTKNGNPNHFRTSVHHSSTALKHHSTKFQETIKGKLSCRVMFFIKIIFFISF